jgi:hypothetical protein
MSSLAYFIALIISFVEYGATFVRQKYFKYEKYVIWDVMACSVAEICRHFGRTHCLFIRGTGVTTWQYSPQSRRLGPK